MWNGPLDWAAREKIMQPFRLSLAGAPFVPRADMLLRWGSWKGPFSSICLKAADLCDNLKTLDVKVSLTHRHLNGSFVLHCDLSVILTWSYQKEESWKLPRGLPGGSSSKMTRALWRGPDDFNSVQEREEERRLDKDPQLVPANVSISTQGMHYSAALIDWTDYTASQMWLLASPDFRQFIGKHGLIPDKADVSQSLACADEMGKVRFYNSR